MRIDEINPLMREMETPPTTLAAYNFRQPARLCASMRMKAIY